MQVALTLNPGGTERLILDLALRLHPELPTAVCCIDEAGAWAPELTAQGMSVTAINRQPGFTWSTAWAIAAAAERHRATVIHAHHYSPFVYSCVARLRRHTPVVFTEHGRLSDKGPSSKRRFVNGIFRRLPARMFAVSSELADHLADEGFARQQVGVIYNGIPAGPHENPTAREDRRRELGAAAGDFIVGTVARLDPVKDLGTLLRAVARLHKDHPTRLVIVGDGPERAGLEALTAELGLAGRVTFLGRRNDAREWLWACDSYANSSISEGVSLTILEAMAAGLPVAATRVGGTSEVVDDACGRLVAARDPEGLATALAGFAKDAALRKALGRAGRERVETRFTIERMVNEYAGVYRAVSAGH